MSPPRILSLFLALAIPPISASVLRAQQAYIFTITDLGTLGGQESQANAVNDYGQVAGEAMTSFGVYRAFAYASGVMYDLGTLGGDYSSATGINNQGQIVGESTTSFNVTRAFSFANGVMYDLGTLGGDYSTAAAINNHGLIVGTAATSSYGNRAFAFTTDGVMHDLGTLGGAYSTATAVSDNNVIVGTAAIAVPPGDPVLDNYFGFVFSGASMQDLAALGGPPSNGEVAVSPNCVNNSGQIAGYYEGIGDVGPTGFLYAGGKTTIFDRSSFFDSNDTNFILEGINDLGLVVGTAQNPETPAQADACIYSGGVMIDLNTLVDLSSSNFSHLTVAAAISNSDYIVGTGTTKSGVSHAYLLSLIAAPSSP